MRKRIHLLEANDSHVLAEDVLNQFGVFVLPRGTVVNRYIRQRLAEFGIQYILVTTRETDDAILETNYRAFERQYESSIDGLKYLVWEIVKGKRIDYPVMNKMTNTIITAQEEPDQVIRCLVKVREVDDYTYYHSINVSFYAMLIGAWLNLPGEDIKLAVEGALLHDIGKVQIPNWLLNKTDKLTAAEFAELKKHPEYGYEMVKDNAGIAQAIKDVILLHHERFDGSGYPWGLKADQLNIYTRIVAVADVYDAMTSRRSYKTAMTPFAAFQEFFAACRSIMDLHIINTLLYNLARYYVGCRVILNTGQEARIVYIPPHCIWKPIVDTGTAFIDLSRATELDIVSMV